LLLPLIREVLGGGTLASAGTGLGASLLEAMVAAIFACILAAAYRQLSSHSTKSLDQTFN
jgi:type II secretory pathway component PulJ